MATASVETFELDVKAYLHALPQLLKDSEGKFALIGRAEVDGVHETREEAMAIGYKKFGVRGFLVQEIACSDLEMGRHWLEACPS